MVACISNNTLGLNREDIELQARPRTLRETAVDRSVVLPNNVVLIINQVRPFIRVSTISQATTGGRRGGVFNFIYLFTCATRNTKNILDATCMWCLLLNNILNWWVSGWQRVETSVYSGFLYIICFGSHWYFMYLLWKLFLFLPISSKSHGTDTFKV